MTLVMLDTNTVSYLMKKHPSIARRLAALPPASVCISSITEAELRFGLAKRPDATHLHNIVNQFLRLVEIRSFDSQAAHRHGLLRAQLERRGMPLGALDLLIAAHAISVRAILVTTDRALRSVPGIKIQDWTK